jgi:drug/metabolite transporter superfamily protein YnfA
MVLRSLVYLLSAGLLEIGDRYLVWLTLRERRSVRLAVLGGLALGGRRFDPSPLGSTYDGGVVAAVATPVTNNLAPASADQRGRDLSP